MFFSKNLQPRAQEEICKELGNLKVVKQGKYLRLPMVITKSKQQIFSKVKEAISQKIQNWKNKFLSGAGKEVMLKAVAFAMPSYVTLAFRLLKVLCKWISSQMAQYWWNNSKNNQSMHWLS